MGELLLVVEDEKHLSNMLNKHFKAEGFEVILASDGEEALKLWTQKKPDLVVLDIMLPVISGLEVLKKIRSTDETPVIMLTAKAEQIDKLLGLEMGADDYITKPFSPRELTARVKAVLRRSQRSINRHIVVIGNLKIDINRFEAYINDYLLSLTTTEYKILLMLSENPGQVFSRLQILERIYGDIYEGYERTVDTHINNLRRKIEEIPDQNIIIKTVYGVGYKIVKENNPDL
jgi:two-component system OmpR family response regulator